LKYLWRAFKLVLPHRGMLALYLFTAIGVAIFSGSYVIIGKTYLDSLGHDTTPHDRLGSFVHEHLSSYFGEGREYLYGLCIIFFVLMVLNALFDFTNTYIASWLAQRLRMEAMERMMSKLLSLDQPYFDKQNSGDLVSRMVSDGDNMRKSIKIFLDFLQQPFMVIALVAVAVYYDWFLFIVGAVGVPLVIVPLQAIIKNITRQQKRYQEKTGDLAQGMLQNLAGIRVIHAYDASEKEAQNFSKLAMSLFRTGMRRNRSRAMQDPLTKMMLGVGLVAVMLVAGWQFHTGRSGDPTAFLGFATALGMLYNPVRTMIGTIGELSEFLPSAERTFQILDVQPTIVDLPNASPCPKFCNTIVFENVSFDYGRGAVLKDFNLTIRAGEKLGIVGKTGSGKSTLLSLLLRFYDPTAGRILIDGADIRTVQMATLRAQMALVAQQPFLFHASVADNIRYGRPGATENEVIEAARSAMIHDEIMQQPEGYQTLCGERGGELFSGGQRQRIAVARAILRNAPILLLDEATSALDAFSERRVQEAIDKLLVSRTSLIVAHRLSTLRNVDRILVFQEHGGVEAIGTHEELLKISPTYRGLWNEQHPGDAREGAAVAT
jgi:subfamily B ATP-binding cassette protein MsbA